MRLGTLYFRLVRLIYAVGLHPKPGSLFYTKVLEEEVQVMGRLKA